MDDTRSTYDRLMGRDTDDEEFDELPLVPASADEIIEPFERGEVLTLPGIGKPMRLRPVTPAVLATRVGRIPNPYAESVVRLLAVQGDPLDRVSETKQIQTYRDNAIAFQHAAALVIMEPPFVMPPKDAPESWRPPKGSIGPMHLKEQDYQFIFYTYIQGSAERLMPFRKPHRVRRSARSGEGVRGPAELVPRADTNGAEA